MNKCNFQVFFLTILLMCASPVWGKTLVIEGKLDGRVNVKKTVSFAAEQTLSKFTYQFSVPATYDNSGNVQRLDNFRVSANPEPTEAKETTDQYGNRSRKLIWHNLTSDAQVSISYTTDITSTISSRNSTAHFPLTAVPKSEQIFLKKSKLVQSDSRQIIELANELTAGASTEHQAVNAILNHVADAIKYKYNPERYDALFGLTTGTGNCQNFSHLAVALLRASGIPARVSIGQALKDRWKIPLDNRGSSLVQGIGEGLHAWIEVWYPDFGWLPCDPQQTRLFTSTRHIKYGHGLDASDVLEYWSGAPVVPRMSESLEAKYSTDTVNLRLREALAQPTSYQLVGPFTAVAVLQQEPQKIEHKPAVIPPVKPTLLAAQPKPSIPPAQPKPKAPPEQPKPKVLPLEPKPSIPAVEPKPPAPTVLPTPKVSDVLPKKLIPPVQPKPKALTPEPKQIAPPLEPKPKAPSPEPKPLERPLTVKPKPLPAKPIHVPAAPKPGTSVEIGNMDFPNLVATSQVVGNVGQRSFDRETAEYATSKYLYTQAFTLDTPVVVKDVALAMRKFGGDGTVYIDVVRDKEGKPSLDGVRSSPVYLDKITRKPGYYWVNFELEKNTRLEPGKYWVVLRHSGEAIMNWFYTPGKRVNGPDDSRSTAQGWQWEDVLSGEFVYRVRGVVAK